jgi:hypothetical protein
MTDPKQDGKPLVETRTPKKKVTTGIFDNLRKLPAPHPVEEILGLSPTEETPTPPTPPTPRTPPTSRTARTPREASSPVAPERDYTKVANSIVREAVAGGYFVGKSKQLYDFLYAKTRGAIVPVRSVKITKPRLMQGSGIGSERTLLKNMRHLEAIGLLQINVTDGAHGGNEYRVFLPEEVNLEGEPTPPTPPTPPTADDVRHALQKVGYVPPVESGVRGVGSNLMDSTTSGESKTFIKDYRTIDDDAALAGLIETLKSATKEVTGREITTSESDRWKELADVLMVELKIAAARTNVSSVPAFLAEHLRRRLWKIDKKQARAEGRELPDEVASEPQGSVDAGSCTDCGGSGWWYPEGESKGVAKCRHEKLNIN